MGRSAPPAGVRSASSRGPIATYSACRSPMIQGQACSRHKPSRILRFSIACAQPLSSIVPRATWFMGSNIGTEAILHQSWRDGWSARGGDCLRCCDAILPVPLHRTRFALRKFNQSAELARHLARSTGKPYLPAALVRTKRTKRQVGLTARAREDNVRAAFAVAEGREAEVFGKHIVLVDDVYTTGATVTAATRALKKAGATEVSVLTFAMALAETI